MTYPPLPPERSWPAWRLAVALVSLAMGLALLLPTSLLAAPLPFQKAPACLI